MAPARLAARPRRPLPRPRARRPGRSWCGYGSGTPSGRLVADLEGTLSLRNARKRQQPQAHHPRDAPQAKGEAADERAFRVRHEDVVGSQEDAGAEALTMPPRTCGCAPRSRRREDVGRVSAVVRNGVVSRRRQGLGSRHPQARGLCAANSSMLLPPTPLLWVQKRRIQDQYQAHGGQEGTEERHRPGPLVVSKPEPADDGGGRGVLDEQGGRDGHVRDRGEVAELCCGDGEQAVGHHHRALRRSGPPTRAARTSRSHRFVTLRHHASAEPPRDWSRSIRRARLRSAKAAMIPTMANRTRTTTVKATKAVSLVTQGTYPRQAGRQHPRSLRRRTRSDADPPVHGETRARDAARPPTAHPNICHGHVDKSRNVRTCRGQ
jgi:hypothetical protein